MSARGEADPRPCIGVSACLVGEPVRYDGGDKREAHLLDRLASRVRWVPLCPEVEAGMGVPRPPIRLEEAAGGVRLIGVEDRRDHTETMRRTSDLLIELAGRHGICGFVLKSRSPSCAPNDAPLHDARGRAVRARAGAFAQALHEALPELPMASEEDLRDAAGCEAFLAAAEAYAAARPR